ncbi:MAG: hypothetical protein EAS48_01350 [Chryseobacterium sp.]|nr:MAG: hypothetical protein EAS48_01350 [Chryseobacterium sp.]
MAYTVIGLFPNAEDADQASKKLKDADFPENTHSVSGYKYNDEYGDSDAEARYDYASDEKTGGFWNWLFGEDAGNVESGSTEYLTDRERNRTLAQAYDEAGARSHTVTVHTDDHERAERARKIMDDAGAVNVHDFNNSHAKRANIDRESNENNREEFAEPKSNRSVVVNKARNESYVLPDTRIYTRTPRTGMSDPTDSLGNKTDSIL